MHQFHEWFGQAWATGHRTALNWGITDTCDSLRALNALQTRGKTVVEGVLDRDEPPENLYVYRNGHVAEALDPAP